jgi:hypothetical protein
MYIRPSIDPYHSLPFPTITLKSHKTRTPLVPNPSTSNTHIHNRILNMQQKPLTKHIHSKVQRTTHTRASMHVKQKPETH